MARQAADAAGEPVFLNARTDTYLTSFGDSPQARWTETVRRGRAYLEAGADSVFVPLLTALEDITALRAELGGLLTVMAFPGAPAAPQMLRAGASRVSIGQSAMLATLGLTARIARELRDTGTSGAMVDTFYGFQEAETLFTV